MSDSQHTPGPWKWEGHSLVPVDPDPARSAVHTILEAEELGRGFISSDLARTVAESNANLSLISASPDLIDAARAAEAVLAKGKWIEGSTDPEAIALFKLRAAIDKAVGA